MLIAQTFKKIISLVYIIQCGTSRQEVGMMTEMPPCLASLPRAESESHSVLSDSLRPHGLYGPWNSPGQNTGVGSLSLFQWIFPTQGLNPGLLHCRRILYQLSHKGSPFQGLLWVKIQGALVVKHPPASAGDMRDMGSIPGSGRSPGGGNGNPLQYSCLGNPIDRGAWQALIHRMTKSWTWLKQ